MARKTIKKRAAKVNYIKLNASGAGGAVRVGQSYLFWIGGYWLQADGYSGKEQFFDGRRWVLLSWQPPSGTFTIVNVNAKVCHERRLTGR